MERTQMRKVFLVYEGSSCNIILLGVQEDIAFLG